MPPPRFAATDDDAIDRASTYRTRDPFPNIPPALLNSADIVDYVAATAMVHPFDPANAVLKPASYKVPIGGDYLYWDERGELSADVIEEGKSFVLHANSIAFVTLLPTFRLPLYIAARFNLRVTNIYRGILLGTGPLVDPGFEGRLSIPLHNLTTNDYRFTFGEGLIWMEFTKVSPNEAVSAVGRSLKRAGELVELEVDKPYRPYRTLWDYLAKAAPQTPIRSSVPTIVEEARTQVDQARLTVEQARNTVDQAAQDAEEVRRTTVRRVDLAALVAVLSIAIALIGIVFQVHQLVDQSNGRFDQLSRSVNTLASPNPAPSQLNARVCSLETLAKARKDPSCP